jgi:hypothetical protein
MLSDTKAKVATEAIKVNFPAESIPTWRGVLKLAKDEKHSQSSMCLILIGEALKARKGNAK